MIDVALHPRDLRPADVIVVVDVLRATSTAVTALAAGYERVLLATGVEQARALAGPERVLAGERRCVPPSGFDQGNSPAEAARRRGSELVLTTTNGTPAVLAATRAASTVLLGSLLNLSATIAVLAPAVGDVQVVCAGTDGETTLEDVYVAGRITTPLDGERTDAARLAETVAASYRSPLAALHAGAGAAALRAAGLRDDIARCACESRLSLVATAVADGELAIATGRAASVSAAAAPAAVEAAA